MSFGKASRFASAATLFVSLSVAAGQGIHIDGSSGAAANRSLQRMLNSVDTNQKTQLSDAIVQLNKDAPDSADPAAGKAPQHPSAARIKDKITGMTAAEIIELAHHTAEMGSTPAK